MNAAELYRVSHAAMEATRPSEWNSPDHAGEREVLTFLGGGGNEDGQLWALVPVDSGVSDCVPIDAAMAEELIKAHLRSWLIDRGWQVQVAVRGQKRVWRLADCLSVADGGGDRLDEDYPAGDDELAVLCHSVIVVASS